MSGKITTDDSGSFIDGRRISTNWKFISDGTWYDSGSEAKLETDCSWMGGLFRGTRTSQMECETKCGQPLGTKYEDGELCMWEEFDIYDENGVLLRKADCDGEDTTLIGIT